MSGPHAEQPIRMSPDEKTHWLAVYRAHRRQIDGSCSCGLDRCNVGFDARTNLWAAGINPDWPNR